MKQLYLASRSPRRRELLTQIGIRFKLVDVEVDETPTEGEAPAALAERLARSKAWAGERCLAGVPAGAGRCVMGADTVVVCNGDILGKPADRDDAEAMLARLSGRSHQVVTAMALVHAGGIDSRVSASDVRFRPISAAERARYCATGEPLDKAGAYGIQGLGAIFVCELRGSYSGVMGLALHHADELLRRVGIEALAC